MSDTATQDSGTQELAVRMFCRFCALLHHDWLHVFCMCCACALLAIRMFHPVCELHATLLPHLERFLDRLAGEAPTPPCT
jgi:hypothetical protein